MPIVRIDYAGEMVSREAMQEIADALQSLTAEATGYTPEEISVFANENQITINAAPVEVYVYANFPEASAQDLEAMLSTLRELMIAFKQQRDITIPFNLSIVKMDWKFELEV